MRKIPDLPMQTCTLQPLQSLPSPAYGPARILWARRPEKRPQNSCITGSYGGAGCRQGLTARAGKTGPVDRHPAAFPPALCPETRGYCCSRGHLSISHASAAGAKTGGVILRRRGAAVERWFARRQSAFAYGAHSVYSARPQDAGRAIRRRQQRLQGLQFTGLHREIRGLSHHLPPAAARLWPAHPVSSSSSAKPPAGS